MINDFSRPSSVAEAFAWKERFKGTSLFLAGGTEINARKDIKADRLISLEPLNLDQITMHEKGIKIGAMVRLQTLLESDLTNVLPGLKSAARNLVNRHIRNMATLGGNIATNRSCSDMIPVLMVYRARMELFQGTPCQISVEEYVENQQEGLIDHFWVPLPASNFFYSLQRHTRSANDLALINVAVGMQLEKGALLHPTVAVGGVAAHVRRLKEVEKALEGISVNEYCRETVEKKVQQNVSPIDDLRGSASFKRHLAGVLVANAVEECIQKGERP